MGCRELLDALAGLGAACPDEPALRESWAASVMGFIGRPAAEDPTGGLPGTDGWLGAVVLSLNPSAEASVYRLLKAHDLIAQPSLYRDQGPATLELALDAAGFDKARVLHRPRLLSDNGSSY